MKLSSAALRFSPWSKSKADLALTCPFSFNLRYVKKAPQEAIMDSAARVGRVVHHVLEKTLPLKDVKKSDLKKILRQGAIDESLTRSEIEESMSYLHNVLSFKKRLAAYTKKHQARKVEIEKRFAFDENLKPVDFWNKECLFRGVWDVIIDFGNVVTIIDHKTGGVSDPKKDLEKYESQQRVYNIAAAIFFPDLQKIKTAFHLVQSEEIVWVPATATQAKIKEHYIPWLENYLNEAGQSALNSERINKGSHCKFCGFQRFCRE